MKILINKSQVKHETSKAFLIKLPNSSKSFWLYDKFVYPHQKGYIIYINEDWFYSSSERGEQFDGSLICEKFENQAYGIKAIEKIIPNKKEAVKVEADKELKR